MKTDDITIRTIQPGERSIQVVEGELETAQRRLAKRDEWLNNPINKKLVTYNAVSQDTQKIREEITELEQELKSLNK